MQDYLTQIVEDYEELVSELTGRAVETKEVAIPFLEEDRSQAPALAPLSEGTRAVHCPECKHSFAPNASVCVLKEFKCWIETYTPASEEGEKAQL